MKRKYAQLTGIENNRDITLETDREFLYCLQNGLLLAIKEQGFLNEIQYRCAEQRLGEQIFRNNRSKAEGRGLR